MPQVIGVAILAAIGASTTASVSFAGATISVASVIGSVVITAASVGLSVALAPRPAAPKHKNQSVELTTEQTVQSRQISYGLVRVGGHKVFEAVSGKLVHRVIALNQGRIGARQAWYLGERRVTWGAPLGDGLGSGGVVDPIEGRRYEYNSVVRITKKDRDGDPSQTALAELTYAFPGDLDDRFRLREIAYAYLRFHDVPDDKFLRVYPNGIPDVSVAFEGLRVYDPRDGAQSAADKSTWVYSDNPVLCYLDALRNPDLCHRSPDFSYADISGFDLPSFIAAANVCDELVAKKGGGSEKRYTVATTFSTDQRPADIERTLLSAMDGWTWITADGKIAVLAGKWIAPTVTLGPEAVSEFHIERATGREAAVNVVKPTIRWPDNQWQETECPPWRDETDIAARGAEYEEIVPFPTGSWRQAQRLAKRAVKRALAGYRGTVTTNLRGELAYGHRFIALYLAGLDITINVEVLRFHRLSADEPGCRIEFVAAAASDWDWNAATEEGEAPEVSHTGEDIDQQIDKPSSWGASSPAAGTLRAAWNNPDGPVNRRIQIEYRLKSIGNPNRWIRVDYSDRTSPKDIAAGLAAGTYETRGRYRMDNDWYVTDWTRLEEAVVA